jgi:DNA-binding CsgD family transcriptional regulator
VRTAGHLAIAAVPGDEATITAMHDAVTELAPASPNAAADLALRLLELVDDEDERRLEIVRSAASVLMVAGRTDEAVVIAERFLGTHRLPGEVEAAIQLELRSAWLFVRFEPYPTPVPAHLQHDPAADPVVVATLTALEHAPPMWQRSAADADQTLETAIRIARESRRAFEFTLVSQLRAIRSTLRGRVEEALAHAEAARGFAESFGSPALLAVHDSSVAAQLAANGRLGDALELLRGASAVAGPAERAAAVASDARDEWTRTSILVSQGRLDDAHAEALPRLELVVGLGYFGRVSLPLATLVETSLRRGESGAASAALTRYGPIAEGVRSYERYAAALVADAQGETAAVPQTLAAIAAELEAGCFDVAIAQPHRLPLLVHIAARAGDEQAARAFARAATTLADQNPNTGSLAAAAAHARGLVEHDLQLLRQAVELAADEESRLFEAGSREDFAAALVSESLGTEAVEQLEAAYEFYVYAGAHRDVARVRAALRALGVRKRQTTVARPRHGWDSLTKSEGVVVDLVATGLTNREAAAELFLSPETINTHLRHAFAKLGIRSRVELARLAAQREPVAG